MEEQWGPWIEWSGGDNPAEGMFVAIHIRGEWTVPNGNPDGDWSSVWAWHHDGQDDDIIRYRIRKPKGLQILQDLLANLPDKVPA